MNSEMADYGAVTGLVAKLWRAMDLGRHDDVLALLTEDCRWQRDGGWQEGTAAIQASMDRRPMDRVVRHTLSNFIVEKTATGASCAYYLMAYEGHGAKTAKPKPVSLPIALADMTTDIVLVNGALRISQIGMDVAFFGSAAS